MVDELAELPEEGAPQPEEPSDDEVHEDRVDSASALPPLSDAAVREFAVAIEEVAGPPPATLVDGAGEAGGWAAIISVVLVVGAGLSAKFHSWLQNRHEQRMKELEIEKVKITPAPPVSSSPPQRGCECADLQRSLDNLRGRLDRLERRSTDAPPFIPMDSLTAADLAAIEVRVKKLENWKKRGVKKT